MSLLSVEGLDKSFGGVVAARDVTFTVEAGRLLAIIGPAGFVRVSPSWETALGFTADELAALPFERLIHPEDQQLSSDAFARAVDAPDVETHFECRVRTSRGDWRWLAWSARHAWRASRRRRCCSSPTNESRTSSW